MKTNTKPETIVQLWCVHQKGINLTLEFQLFFFLTVLILVKNDAGLFQEVRSLLNGASQSLVITEACMQHLSFKRYRSEVDIDYLSYIAVPETREVVLCDIGSLRSPELHITSRVLILKNITKDMPSVPIADGGLEHLDGLPLADPHFATPSAILSAEIVAEVMTRHKITGEPHVFHTRSALVLVTSSLLVCTDLSLEVAPKKFWGIEDLARKTFMPVENQSCEQHFQDTQIYDSEGKHVLRLPFATPYVILGNFYGSSLKRLQVLECLSQHTSSLIIESSRRKVCQLKYAFCMAVPRRLTIDLCILWRNSTSDPVSIFELNTVTNGLASSPFQVLQRMQKMAIDEGAKYPLTASNLLNYVFVDNIVNGADNVSEALGLKALLLHTSCYNHSIVVNSTDASEGAVNFESTSSVNVLGVHWDLLYDPCTWLAIVMTASKIMIQVMCTRGLIWDKQVGRDVSSNWEIFKAALSLLSLVRVQILIPVV
ncbi:hypothetical protein PR048_026935 [Dryococelus australis]|uniref:Uncharacterized protein n=1 Tax=Dryococelus australis TaxID=614101 RepID=A0ABQ9GMP1_9NEOP|nr:hypothetical protein PR048_026935 [Dryococelus australis]